MQHHSQSDVYFRLMSLEFRLRDLVWPPSKILKEAGLRSGMHVLDFGCGPGSFSLAAARLVGPHGRVYALDIHPLAIRCVTRAAARHGITNIFPVLGSNTGELPSESIDMALLYDVLHDITDAAETLAGIHRVLRVERVLSVRDHHLKEKTILDSITAGGPFRFTCRDRWTLRFERIRQSEE